MSRSAFVVLPIAVDGALGTDQDTVGSKAVTFRRVALITSAIQQAIHQKTHPEEFEEPKPVGAFKQIIVVVSGVEFISRFFGPASLSVRIRPKEYKKVPEARLNATLKDIHDFVQYAVVQGQRIIFEQDLHKTFVAFIGFTALYWSIKLMRTFWLAPIALTLVYLAPLIVFSAGRTAAQDGNVRVQEVTNTAVDGGKELPLNCKAKASELASSPQECARAGEEGAQNLAQNSIHTANDLFTGASNNASDAYERVIENLNKLPQMGSNMANKTGDAASSAAGSTKQYINNSLSDSIGNSIPDSINGTLSHRYGSHPAQA
ncbi:uncharacterized protein AB675_5853 [Cyphellophora attinorum]|uniref:Reticulon domain-containing protein n=1 Tax=Cyphellophora attinorum TaxID=1664694 RepID=A0A0N1NYK3_9EURO|nr:uncharacterized protein AB675_5853 [Phialophora attinorum]KPI38773.1 hypothetical protein AB675_5853 [Phialophora attinorum]